VRVVGDTGVVAEWSESGGWTSVAFHALLNDRVVAAVVQSARVLELQFQNGPLLQVLDDSEQYESMQIYLPGGEAPIVI
jgi:hypothetical protein